VARRWGVELSPVDVAPDAPEIERAVTALARSGNGGLIVTPGPAAKRRRDLIAALEVRHHLPAVYGSRHYVAAGGLISYGPDLIDLYRRAAGYVDRILKGEKPADLPVQAPTKYELVINLKTAKAWPRAAGFHARARRRGDRVSLASANGLLHLLTSGFGTKRRFVVTRQFGRFWSHSGHWWTCDLARLGRV